MTSTHSFHISLIFYPIFSVLFDFFYSFYWINPLKTSPKYTPAGVYEKCVLSIAKSNRLQRVNWNLDWILPLDYGSFPQYQMHITKQIIQWKLDIKRSDITKYLI